MIIHVFFKVNHGSFTSSRPTSGYCSPILLPRRYQFRHFLLLLTRTRTCSRSLSRFRSRIRWRRRRFLFRLGSSLFAATGECLPLFREGLSQRETDVAVLGVVRVCVLDREKVFDFCLSIDFSFYCNIYCQSNPRNCWFCAWEWTHSISFYNNTWAIITDTVVITWILPYHSIKKHPILQIFL